MPRLEQMEVFYFVATWKNFSRAAIELNVSKGYVSTQISALEKDLGIRLLHRSTRHLRLTEEGELFYESCAKIVKEKQQGILLLKELQSEPSGHLKISAPPSICTTILSSLLPKFQKQYPRISIAIDSSPTVKNLIQHGIDIALRITHAPDEYYIARMLGSFRFVVCATPAYLKQLGNPNEPNDLLRYNCLIYSADPTQQRWPFETNGKIINIKVQGNLVASETSIIKEALLCNQGIARLPEYVLKKEIDQKKLIAIFSNYTQLKTPIYAIYQSNINIPLKIKCFINFLIEQLI